MTPSYTARVWETYCYRALWNITFFSFSLSVLLLTFKAYKMIPRYALTDTSLLSISIGVNIIVELTQQYYFHLFQLKLIKTSQDELKFSSSEPCQSLSIFKLKLS